METELLEIIAATDRIRTDEPMGHHTTIRCGGSADLYIAAHTEDELTGALSALRRTGVPSMVIGRGSNLLFADDGFRGAVIQYAGSRLEVRGSSVYAQAGATLKQLYEKAVSHNLVGLEFAAGIPGSVGGAVVMNAGAYGGELADVVSEVHVMDPAGRTLCIPAADMRFGYRSSAVLAEGYVVLSAVFQLKNGDADESRRLAGDLSARRKAKQPLDQPSAGSVFRRPAGHFAGALIEQSGLKGALCGGAQVSPKHAGFIVNADHASAADVYRLICEVQRVVYCCTGIALQPEIQFVGDFDA